MIGLFFMKLWVLSALNTTEAFNPAPGSRFSLGRTVLNFEGVGNSEIYSAASACLEEECSVDTVDMLVAQRAAEFPGGRGASPSPFPTRGVSLVGSSGARGSSPRPGASSTTSERRRSRACAR